MKQVIKLIRRLDASTEPFEGILDGKNVFVKIPNGTWGKKILINEFICLRLAQALNIPIPNGGKCIINEKTDIDNVIDEIDYSEDITGVCFFSERLEKSQPIVIYENALSKIANKFDINKIALFDHIIYNEDRHKGNILLQHSMSIGYLLMYIIDHSHVFNLKHEWNKNNLKELISNEDFKDKKIMELNNDELYKIFFELKILNRSELIKEKNKFQLIINDNLLDKIFKEIPKEWVSDEEDLDALKKYILYRVNNIDYFVELILSYNGGV